MQASKKLHRMEENIGAAAVELTPNDLRQIDGAVSKVMCKVTGIRKGWNS